MRIMRKLQDFVKLSAVYRNENNFIIQKPGNNSSGVMKNKNGRNSYALNLISEKIHLEYP